MSRPRDPTLDETIRAGAVALLREVGCQGFRVEALAARVALPKTTIYRRWPSAAALLDHVASTLVPTAVPETATPRDALVELVATDRAFAASVEGRAALQVLGAGRDPGSSGAPELEAALRARRHQYHAVAAQVLRPDRVPPAVDLLVGAAWGPAIVAAEEPGAPAAVVDLVLAGAGD